MGIDLADIHALSDFSRNSRQFIQRLKKTGKPSVLTVNGQAEVVIQSAKAYQKLIKNQDLLDSLRGISRGLEQANRNEGRAMRRVIEELARKRGVSLK